MQLTKSKFVLAAHGVQLDNGVASPWDKNWFTDETRHFYSTRLLHTSDTLHNKREIDSLTSNDTLHNQHRKWEYYFRILHNMASWSVHVTEETNATQPSPKVRILFSSPPEFR